jgi:GMP synthase (glutamine-hydrolysing)
MGAPCAHKLAREPERRDLACQLGLDKEVTVPERRMTELRNFIDHIVWREISARSRA